jgi:hypothetical protein
LLCNRGFTVTRDGEDQSLITDHGSHRRVDWFGAGLAGVVVVLFSLALLWHDRLIFWNDDYEISILPVFADVARSWNEGHLPLLSPYSWVCSNLAGEFQYGTFSIFVNAAVVLIWKFPLTFPQQAAALSMAHLFVLAAGAFLLGRERGLSRALAMLVAIVTTLSGWIICWGATDWFGALAAFAWLPWCWWSLERSLRSRALAAVLWPAPFVYLLIAGGFPYTVVMLGLLVGWLFLREVCVSKRLTVILPTLGGIALGFGLSAPAWLALLDYVHGSNRSAQSAMAHWQWLVPPAALPGFVLPSWTVNWADFSTRYLPRGATELACGLVPPVALIWGFIFAGRPFVRRIRWDLGLLMVVLLLSMVPSAGFFRWSFRWLPFLHLVLVICAAEALRSLQERRLNFWQVPAIWALAFLALAGAAGSFAGANGVYGSTIIICMALLSLGWLAVEFSPPALRAWAPAAVALGALLATYFVIPPNYGVPKYNFSQDLTNPEPLSRDRLYLAVYSPAEYAYRREYRNGPVGQVARPGSTSMWAGLRLINGYSPILASGVAREFKFFIHGEIDGDVGRYLVTNQAGRRGILEELGVDGLLIASEIAEEPDHSLWRLAFANDEGRVFHRVGDPLAHVRSVDWIDSLPDREFAVAAVSGIVDQRNRVMADIEVPTGDKPALLTFSRPFFRGYRAVFEGRALQVDSYRGLFPVVEIPAGTRGHLNLIYRPSWLVWGAVVSLGCVIVFVFLLCAGRVVTRQSQ